MFRHLVSAITFGVIALNLLFWSVPLLLLSVYRALIPASRASVRKPMEWIYRAAVAVDDAWLRGVLRLDWPQPALQLSKDTSYVVLANHRSWMDIFLVQSVVAPRGPIVKFLAKRQLAWIPVIGLICWAFDFPLLKRRAGKGEDNEARREADRARVRDACAVLAEAPGAMLSFAEGTRFTADKHRAFQSPYENLLPPRPGGFAAMCDAIPDAQVIDITIHYPGESNFWQLLGGGLPAPWLEVDIVNAPALEEAGDWLADRWQRKDRILSQRTG